MDQQTQELSSPSAEKPRSLFLFQSQALPREAAEDGVIVGWRVWRKNRGELRSLTKPKVWIHGSVIKADKGYFYTWRTNALCTVVFAVLWCLAASATESNWASLIIYSVVALVAGLAFGISLLETCHLKGDCPCDRNWISRLTKDDEGAFYGCGVHAFSHKSDALAFGQDCIKRHKRDCLVLGTVELWGKVVEHEHGYRAQYARIKEIVEVVER